MGLVALADSDDRDLLDDHIEAQVHGPVVLPADVEAVVLDPSHQSTGTEEAARRIGCPVEWHDGFRISVAELRRHSAYRGPQAVELGSSLAHSGHLDPAVLGDAFRGGRHDGQELKRVWHLLARFGAPGVSQASPA